MTSLSTPGDRAARGRRTAAAVRQVLRSAGIPLLRPDQDAPVGAWVHANGYRDGEAVVQVLGSHKEFLRAREVLQERWLVRFDRLGQVWVVS